jgi:hypothetical protein
MKIIVTCCFLPLPDFHHFWIIMMFGIVVTIASNEWLKIPGHIKPT